MGALAKFENLSPLRSLQLQEEYGGSLAIHRIFAMAVSRGAQTCIVETDPEETEYNKEFDVLFRHITNYRNRPTPTRIHFFKAPIKDEAELNSLKKTGYLGYVDLRPTAPQTSCWALLDKELIVGPSSQYIFLTCHKKYRIKVGSKRFTIDAFPYMQQDGLAVRCAQAALATISNYLDAKITGPDFTEKVKLHSPSADRAIPSAGLTARQICMGIREMGREPLLFDLSSISIEDRASYSPEQHIYHYVESGIPVLIGIQTAAGNHAVVAAGHTFTPDSWMAESESGYYNFPKDGISSNWVRRYVVQDDNFGPYTLAPSELLRGVCFLIAIPLPPHIYMDGYEATYVSKYILDPEQHNLIGHTYEKLGQLKPQPDFSSDVEFWKDELIKAVADKRIVLRPKLLAWDAYKKIALSRANSSVYSYALNKIATPNHVWQVEISWPEIFCHQRLCIGEIVMDASSPVKSGLSPIDQGWLLFKIPGALIYRNLETSQSEINSIPNDPCILRHHQCK